MKFIIVVILLATAFPTNAETETLLRLHGSTTVGTTLGPQLIKAWLSEQGYKAIKERPLTAQTLEISATDSTDNDSTDKRVTVEIHSYDSDSGFHNLGEGKADIGMASRRISQKERKRLATLGAFDTPTSEYLIGRDSIAVIVHPENPLQHLDKQTLGNIFAGNISDWSQLRRALNGKIQLYVRNHRSSTDTAFRRLAMNNDTPLAHNAKQFSDNAALADAVAENKHSIGFVNLASIRQAKALAIADGGVNTKITAIKPDAFTVASEDYALMQRLFLYVPSESTHPLARKFADFAVSPRGQDIVDRAGFVSQKIRAQTPVLDEKMPQEYRELTQGAQRLSLNIHFDKDSSALDSDAKQDLERLSAFMKTEDNRGRKLLLFGFSDSHEARPLYGIGLSVHRADIVADVLISKKLAPVRVRGYGSNALINANKTRQGRDKNRRVEVWLR